MGKTIDGKCHMLHFGRYPKDQGYKIIFENLTRQTDMSNDT